MVNNLNGDNGDKLSMRHSVLVWVAGAVLGWVVAVASVYTALQDPDATVAESPEGIPPEEAEKMENIMPAAGAEKQEQNP